MKDSDATFFIELYIVKLKTGTIYLAATDTDITFAGQTYMAIPFQRETIDRSMDNVIDTCEISLGDGDYDKLAYLSQGFDFRGADVTIFKISYPDSLEDDTIKSISFMGYINSCSYSDGVFSFSLNTRLPNIEVPNRTCQLCCNSEFGDSECGISLEETNVELATGSTSSNILLPSTYETNYWKDGVIFIKGESRLILSNEGNKIVVNYSFLQSDIKGGMEATLIRGCDKTKETCQNRFNNMKNFSGFPAIPFENVYR
nr:MAG TPA: minor tail protein [Caudoviricetes sp.]